MQVAEKLSLMEQYKLEKERQQKVHYYCYYYSDIPALILPCFLSLNTDCLYVVQLEEEEEIRRLRRELVPKAQPMPYFDRPFIPRR